MSVRAVVLVALLVAGCGGDGPPRAALSPSRSSARPSRSASATARPSPRPSPSASRRPTPRPSPSASRRPTGTPVTAAGTALRYVSNGEVKAIGATSDCTTIYPELLDVSCDEVRLDGGSVLWVAGTDGGYWRLRLLTFVQASGGYVLRYDATDTEGRWSGFRVRAAALAGHGTDSLVVITGTVGDEDVKPYDVLTWRSGGQLVLRAHREPFRGRIVAMNGRVDEYEAVYEAGEQACCPSRYAYRRLVWDGRQFLLGTIGAVPTAKVPKGD